MIPHSPTAPIPDDGSHAPRLHARAHRRVVPRAHHVGQGQQRAQDVIRVPGTGDGDQGAIRQGDAHGLALSAVNLAVPESPTVDALGGDASATVRAGAIAVGKRGDHEIAPGDAPDLGANLLDDADKLVADGTLRVRGLATVVPEVRAADAPQHDAHDGVRWCRDDGVRPGCRP